MSLAVVQSAVRCDAADAATGIATTPGITTTAGNALLVVCAYEAVGFASLVDNDGRSVGAGFTEILAETTDATPFTKLRIFLAQNLTGKVGHTVTMTLASAYYLAVAVIEISGQDAAAFEVSTGAADAGSTSHVSPSLTPTRAPSFLLGVGVDGSQNFNDALAAGAGWTEDANALTAFGEIQLVVAHKASAALSADTFPWTSSNDLAGFAVSAILVIAENGALPLPPEMPSMSVLDHDLLLIGSAVMAEDDVTLAIGGPAAPTRKVRFSDLEGLVQLVSSSAADTAPVTLSYWSAAVALLTETVALTGLTAAPFLATVAELLKAVKSGSTVGDVALEAQEDEYSGEAAAVGATWLDLDAADEAVALPAGALNQYVLRLLGATAGAGQIREVIASAPPRVFVRTWGVLPTGTVTYRLSKGMVFDRAPTEILEVRRALYGVESEASDGAERTYYEKLNGQNAASSGTLGSAFVRIPGLLTPDGPTGSLATLGYSLEFGLGAVNGAGTNGAFNRRVAPGGIAFGITDQAVPGGALGAGDTIEIWLKYRLRAGGTDVRIVPSIVLDGVSGP